MAKFKMQQKAKEKIQKRQYSVRFIVVSIITIAVIFLLLGVVSLLSQLAKISTENEGEGSGISETEFPSERFILSDNATRISMQLPAVDADGNGVVTWLSVEATKGTGRTLVDIDSLLFWADTQHSIRQARLVAGNIADKDLDEYDFVYSVYANASLIGGPSAGAALAIATIAAIENKPLREDVIITGTINHDGTIGPVSEILAKAKASKSVGANIFLVPLLQSRDVVYETTQNCETFGVSEICTTETRPRKINITEETGIDVVEVESVQDAMKYFFEG